MEHAFDTVNPIEMMTTSTSVISSLFPLIAMLLGFILAFYILSEIISLFVIVKDVQKLNIINKNYQQGRVGTAEDYQPEDTREDIRGVYDEYTIDY